MDILKHAQALGRLGGSVKSERKAIAVRANGKLGGKSGGLGGRPREYPKCPKYRAHVFSPRTGKCYGCDFTRPLTLLERYQQEKGVFPAETGKSPRT